jgi:hypothetical protein
LRSLIVFIVCILQLSSCAQPDTTGRHFTPAVRNHFVALGDTTLTIQISIYDSSSRLVFVHLHDDEQTAKEATHVFLERNGGILISILNNGKRLISFPIKGNRYVFDPNRIFTRKGIIESLKLFQPYRSEAVPEVEKLAFSLLVNIPDSAYVIAMHNNTDQNYSVQSYLPEGELPGVASKVHVSKSMDPDDFVYTTDPLLFTRLQQQDISVVLQKNKPATDDGSLSILSARRKQDYTNIEAEHGHYDVQLRLLLTVAEIITDKKISHTF